MQIDESEVKELLDKAMQSVRIADHMIVMTYQTVQDPKLLLAVVKRLQSAVLLAIKSAVKHERLWKRIPPTLDTEESLTRVFTEKIAKRYNVKPELLRIIRELSEIVQFHKSSPIEFSRHGKFVIATNDYKLRTLTKDHVKQLVIKTRALIQSIEKGIQASTPVFESV
ncbi:hypothetical protein J7L02_00600 [Candidatus Woesearchaeota archaeon]|nr:hypothetical protein [Candidatus Woesearchaeota archaeon]